MKALLLASAFLALFAPVQKGVQVNVNAKNGDVITGEKRFRVTVTANDPVTQVEFYAGNDLRDKDTSTPYEFVIDGLSEADGNLKLRFKAYTTEGQSGEAVITVKIDNGVSKGLDFHLKAGEAALQDSKWDVAITAGRIALKVDPKSIPAHMVLARAYLATGDTAKAQKNAEDVLEVDPGNAGALDLLSAISLRTAFRTYTMSGGNRKDSLTTIREAFKSAVESRRKVLDASVDALGPITPANLIAVSNAAFRAGRYNLVVPALRTAIEKDNKDVAIADRLAYAYLRTGRNADALATLNAIVKNGVPTAFTYAALAVAKAEAGDVTGSDGAIRDALVSDPEDLAVIAGQAFLALKYVRNTLSNTYMLNYDDLSGTDATAKIESRKTLNGLVSQLEKAAVARTETLYFKEALYNKLGDFARAQGAFQAAVLAEPTNYDAFIEAGNRALASTQLQNLPKEDLEQALTVANIMFDTALIARPDSAQALTGLALVATIEGKLDQAIKFGDAAVRANPDYAAGHLALGTAYNMASTVVRKQADAVRAKSQTGGTSSAERQALELEARKLEDQAGTYARNSRDEGTLAARADKRLEGQELSKPYAAWRYYTAGGRTAVLPQPK
jgi:tetratricopeptide (TPR) repeat protein